MGLLGAASLAELTPDLLRRQAPRFAPAHSSLTFLGREDREAVGLGM